MYEYRVYEAWFSKVLYWLDGSLMGQEQSGREHDRWLRAEVHKIKGERKEAFALGE